jgi:hydroxymethylpyrimidine/phosphomethylpyrimidine kinase
MMIAKMSWLICNPISASSSTGGTSCTLAVLMASSMTIGLDAVSSDWDSASAAPPWP